MSPPHPAIDLSAPLYYQLVYTLSNLLPPPLDDTPEALRVRNHAAIAKVAALLPVNADEADLAAQCIAARAQAEEMLRLLRQHAGDIGIVMRLNAQYGSMVRTSLSVHGRLMRVQALRHKREATGAAATQDAWTLHVAEQSMLAVVHPDSRPLEAASPRAAPVEASPRAAPVEASPKVALDAASPKVALDAASPKVPLVATPAACLAQGVAGNVSETGTNSQDAAFETWLSEQPWNAGGSGETDLRDALRQAMASSRLANRPASRRKGPGKVDYRCHINGATAST